MKAEGLIFVALLALSCGSTVVNSDPGQCSPACGQGLACCSEPTHLAPDAGPPSIWTCVTPNQGACPQFP